MELYRLPDAAVLQAEFLSSPGSCARRSVLVLEEVIDEVLEEVLELKQCVRSADDNGRRSQLPALPIKLFSGGV